jgi:hypothetical protein
MPPEANESVNALESIAKKLGGYTPQKDAQGKTVDPSKAMGDFENYLKTGVENAFKDLKIPFLEHIGSSRKNLKDFQNQLQALDKAGFKKAGVAAKALGGPLGLATTGMIAFGKTMWEFHKLILQTQMDVAKMSVATGDLSENTRNADIIFRTASQTVEKWGSDLKDVTGVLAETMRAGIKPTSDGIGKMLRNLMLVKTGFQVTNSTIGTTTKFLRQEQRIRKDVGLNIAGLTDGYKNLNMTADDYLKTVVKMSQGFIDFGISAATLSTELKNSIAVQYGATRAQKHMQEMVGGPRRAGMGQRAYLAEQLGVGQGLGGAARLAYGKGVDTNLGKGVLELAQKELGLGDISKMQGAEKWDAGAQAALFAKQFGISERTVYEALGLELKKPQETLVELGKKQIEVAEKNVETLGGLRDEITEFTDLMKSSKYFQLTEAGKKVREEGFKTAISPWNPLNRHSGGMIPRYHNGLAPDERQAILKAGEGVLNDYAGVPAAGGPDGIKALNEGKPLPSSGTQINVDVAIPVIKEVIEQALTNLMRENPTVMMF